MVIDSDKYLKIPLLEDIEKQETQESSKSSLIYDYESFIYYSNAIDKAIGLMDNPNNIKQEIFLSLTQNLTTINSLLTNINNDIFYFLLHGQEPYNKINLICSNIEGKIKECSSKFQKICTENSSDEVSSNDSIDDFLKIEKILKETQQFSSTMKHKVSLEILKLEGQPILFNKKRPRLDFTQIAVEKMTEDNFINVEYCVISVCIILVIMVIVALSCMKIFSE